LFKIFSRWAFFILNRKETIMTDWAVNDHSFGPDTLDAVLALMETAIEAVDEGKTIELCDIWPTGGGLYEGALIIEA